MANDAGMSIKERLAMLQASNKNPQLSGPMKPPTHVPQKSSTLSGNKTTDHTDKPNGPAAALKPALKPVNGGSVAGDAKENDAPPLAFKLRSTGSHLVGGKGVTPAVATKPKVSDTEEGGVVVPPAPKFNDSPARGGAGEGGAPAVAKKPGDAHGGVTPLVPKKPGGGGGSGDTAGTAPVTMRDKSSSSNTPRPPSIQERMAALREKAGDGGGSDGGAGPKSPDVAPKRVPLFPPKGDVPAIKPSDLLKSLHEAAKRKKTSEFLIRNSDGKRFRKVDVASAKSSDPAPAKPPALDNVDLVTFLQAYATAKEMKLKKDAAQGDKDDTAAAGGEDGEMDELYVEAESEIVPLRIRGRGSVKRATSVRVSAIPEFTEEEEQQDLYTDGLSAEAAVAKIPQVPEEEYDDCASAAATVLNQSQEELEEPDEIYEPLDDEIDSKLPPEPVASPGPTDDKKTGQKEKEKEKEGKKDKKKDKAKEETNKKEEKERKKREEEIKKQRAKFGLKEGDEKVGDGVVKNNASGGVFNKDLAVSKGEIVTILRMDHNPSGKWLVQNDQGKLGFVSSNNIEVATPAIRKIINAQASQMMTSGAGDSLPGDDEESQEVYEALPEGEMDEIYEEL